MSRALVIITSYNDARTVAATIASVAAQGGIERVLEVALLDDASGDDTVAQARGAWTGPTRFTVVATPHNLGPWANLNRALEYAAAHADWAIVLHADDTAEPGWIAALLERSANCPDDVASISSSWNVLWADGSRMGGENTAGSHRRIDGGPAAVADTLMRGCWWKLSGAAIRTRAYQDAGAFDARYPQCGDWEWLLRVLDRGWAIEYIPRSLVTYRQHGATMSTRAMREDLEITDALRLLDRYAAVMARAQRGRFIARRARYLGRRIARAVYNYDIPRIRTALRTAAQVAHSARRHLL
ncbi:MAG: glycosyltransferase family 2 protein [Gemmatimonadota bacterium]